MKKLALITSLIVITACGRAKRPAAPIENAHSWLYQLQNAEPQLISETGFDMVVMDYSFNGHPDGEYSREDITTLLDRGIVPIAYLSIGEAEDYRFYWRDEWNNSPPSWLGSENPDWGGNYAVRYWDPEWQSIIFSYLRRIVSQGFSGIYLDRVDEFEYWADSSSPEDTVLSESEAAELMASFIMKIADSARAWTDSSFIIIPQNGERLIRFCGDELLPIVNGWAVEDMFYDGTARANEDETNERLGYLQEIINLNKPILSVDYVDDGTGYTGENKERIDDYIRLARMHNMIPYAALSDRELDTINIIDGIQPPH